MRRLPLRLDHRPDNTLQVGDNRSAVLGDIELDSLLLILRGSVVRGEIERVVATGSKQDSGADLAIFSILRQTVGKIDKLINELEKFWWVGHGISSFGVWI